MLSSIFSYAYFYLFPKEDSIDYLVVRPRISVISAINTDCLKSYFSFYDDVKKDLLL